jgi:NitT/TauT family transport system ATP-binding protein
MNNFFKEDNNIIKKTEEPPVVNNYFHDDDNYYEDLDIISLHNIRQEYQDNKVNIFKKRETRKMVIFDNLNLTIKDKKEEGQFIVIMGKSGSGKSTILRYISGLQTPTRGSIKIYGKNIKEHGTIPMVFQQYSSFPWMTVEKNIGLSLLMNNNHDKEYRDKLVSKMIRIVGLEGHEKKWAKYPILSGGQLQRVAIARNLIASPQILLMDEPFGALDTVTRGQMQLFLRGVYENAEIDPTIILVTHDIREAVFLATDIIILGDNPSHVKYDIKINLPTVRDISVKNSNKYIDYVNSIEEFMNNS